MICGDGIVGGAEECDAQGESARCNADCTLAACGDGVLNATAGEDCDDGGLSATCDLDCTVSECGDTVLNELAGELCDEGGESAACNADCTLSMCGDGIINRSDGEQCDDGDESETCDSDCTVSMCGDGVINRAAGEICDDGGRSRSCDVDCTPAECGDGVLNQISGELCDTGGPSETCDADCVPTVCGDGVVNTESGEQCDDTIESATCDLDCTFAMCGDGVINPTAGEACDDMGESMNCDSDCTPAECGDGLLNPTSGESCDDMGESAICDLDCTTAGCGDGVVNATAGEDCDNMGSTAMCDADCTEVSCGDGVANAAASEECDGADLQGATCQSEGYPGGGTLACTGGCTLDVSGCSSLPEVPTLQLAFSPIKQFDFSWAAVVGATYYQLYESAAPGEPFVPLGGNIMGVSVSHTMPLHYRYQASYYLSACNAIGCSDSAVVDVMNSLVDSVGYFKASNAETLDWWGWSVALSGDGTTLAVGALNESSSATGIDGDQADNTASGAGAVYVFTRDAAGVWSQQAYVKASNTEADDDFGTTVALNGDGTTLAVGAMEEDSGATGIDGDQADNSANGAGAVYVFSRDEAGLWSQEAYVKASNAEWGDFFGHAVGLSADGDTMAVGAWLEDSSTTGIDGDQADNGTANSGAVYLYDRDGAGGWSQQAYVKASNPGPNDYFGYSVQLSADGSTLAVGAYSEDSSATGIDGDPANDGAMNSGAAYVFSRDGTGVWSQQAYVKATNTGSGDQFGIGVGLSGDGDTLAVGARAEDSSATGIGGNQADNGADEAGAVYIYSRDGASVWSQQAYVKASNTESGDEFGYGVALSTDGDTLAVTAYLEDGSALGIDGDQADNAAQSAGAVYVYRRDSAGGWLQQAYVKASNSGVADLFGSLSRSIDLSDDGTTLTVGAAFENSSATGIDGDQTNDAGLDVGAVYLY